MEPARPKNTRRMPTDRDISLGGNVYYVNPLANAVMAVESSFSADKPHFPLFIGAHLEDLFEISGDNDAAGVLNRFEVAYVRPEILHLRDYHETLTLEETVAKIVDAMNRGPPIHRKGSRRPGKRGQL